MTIDAGLFRGFTAGDGLSDLRTAGSDIEMRSVSVYDIDEHPGNRKVSDAKVAKLKESILREGLAQLPAVRIHPQNRTRYEHIAGWHRILAYRALHDETGDPKWANIQVVVLKACDDETSERLMWQTNLISSDLTEEERGRGYEVLAGEVARAREENPEAYKGVRTNDAIAKMMSDAGKEVSARSVARARKALRDMEEGAGAPQAAQKERTAAEKAYAALDSALSRLERLQESGESVPVDLLVGARRRLKRLAAQSAGEVKG